MWWFEVLPSLALMAAACAAPQQLAYYVSKWQFGNPMRRLLSTDWDYNMNERDTNINGVPWKKSGLEAIPDN